MDNRRKYFVRMDDDQNMEIDSFQKKESLVQKVLIYRLLPILMVVLSMSCLFFGWIRIPENLQEDLNNIQKYVDAGNTFLDKYLKTSEFAGIDTKELGELISLLSEGELTPYDFFSKRELVQNTSDSVSRICKKLNLESEASDALETLAESLQLFRLLFYAAIITGVITIVLILFREKILGNWYFTIVMMLMGGWCWKLANAINKKIEGEEIHCTLLPFVAILLSLPIIAYGKKKRR